MRILDKTCIKALGMGSCGKAALTSNVDVKDGKIVRTRPLHIDAVYDDDYLRPWTVKARGSEFSAVKKTDIPPFAFAYKKRAYSRNRIPYPMKRVDWDPHGERHPETRGISKYERISWDEATQIIAGEITRIHSEYGPMSILCQGDGHGESKIIHGPHSCQMGLLALMGGFTLQARNPDSWEGWYWGAKHVWGCDKMGQADMGNLVMDIAQNADVLLHWGCDAETTPWGWMGFLPSRYLFWLTEIGVEQVFISPDLNYSGAVHADKWIPIKPNTDAALQAAILYVWFTKGWYDKEYVDTHCIGADWEWYYVSGQEDGIEKTPEWAEQITGVPSRIIKKLAQKWYEQRVSIGHVNGGSYIRSCYSSEPGRFEPVLMAMQGLGKPGRNVTKFIEWGIFGGAPKACPQPRAEFYPNMRGAYQGFDWNTPSVYDARWRHIPKTLVPEAILGEYTLDNPLKWHGIGCSGWPRTDQFNEYQYPNPRTGDQLHMIWSDCPCWTTCWNGGNKMIAALRHPSIETYVVQHPWFENDCHFADILLPIATKFELDDINGDDTSYFNLVFLEDKCIEPIGEAKSDWEAVCEVAKKLGLFEEYTKGRDVAAWQKHGFETCGIDKYLSWEQFQEQRLWASPTSEGWEDLPRGFQPFAEDPENHPLETPTGYLEIYSQTLAEQFPWDEERPPYPKYIVETDRFHEREACERAQQYPFLLVSNHPRWRVHANMDDISWFREIETCKVVGPDGYAYEPIWVNPVTADRLGLAQGDVAKMYNERGAVLGGVYITERIMPDVLYQDHGARLDPIIPGEFDRGGANNLICPTNTAEASTSAEVTSGYLVNIEKVDVFELAAQYPEAFGRSYQVDEGIDIDNFIA